jgi:hypothetical protein
VVVCDTVCVFGVTIRHAEDICLEAKGLSQAGKLSPIPLLPTGAKIVVAVAVVTVLCFCKIQKFSKKE